MTPPDLINRIRLLVGFVLLLVIAAAVAWGLVWG